jgi:hypothetical protein
MKHRNPDSEPNPIQRPLWNSILRAGLILLSIACAAGFVTVCLLYRSFYPVRTLELGDMTPDAGIFLRTEGEAIYLKQPEKLYPVGNYTLKIASGRAARLVLLRVRDTIPPAAEGVETTV